MKRSQEKVSSDGSDSETSETLRKKEESSLPNFPLILPKQILDFACGTFDHSTNAFSVAAAGITGLISCHRITNEKPVLKFSIQAHKKSCRAISFNEDESQIYSGSKDKSWKITDVETTNCVLSDLNAHEEPINALIPLSEKLFATGDEGGCVKIWDNNSGKSIQNYTDHQDFVSDMVYVGPKKTLLTVSADGFMNIYDIRKSKLVAKSEQQDDELLSIAVVKNNKKVVVGTQDGTLLIFTWGQWLDCTDRLPGHPSSINSLLPISSDCIVTGADDGIMRLIGIIPNKLIGVVGLHVKGSGIDFLKEDVDEDEDRNGDDDEEGFPVEKVKSIPGTNWIASSSHDEVVRFWDVGWVHETDELPNQVDEGEKISDDEGESEEEKQTVRKKKSRKKAKRGLELPKQNLFADLD